MQLEFFCGRFSKNTEVSKFMKIHTFWVDLFRANGTTDRHDEANSRFSQFCEGS